MRYWLIPIVWAVGSGLLGYAWISSTGIGAVSYSIHDPHDPNRDIFARREARHRLLGIADGAVGLVAGLALARLRSRWAGAAVGGLAGAAIGLGGYWGILGPLPQVEGSAAFLAALGLPLGFATVRQTDETNQTTAA